MNSNSKKIAYLDYAASHPLLQEAGEACIDSWQNPSNIQSSHPGGAEHVYTEYKLKEKLAELFSKTFKNIEPQNIVLTPSGSHANRWSLEGIFHHEKSLNSLIRPFFCHKSTASVNEANHIYTIQASEFEKNLTLKKEAAKSIDASAICYVHSSVNNIDGRPVTLPTFKGGILHIDHVQGLLKTEVNKDSRLITVAVSAHKIGGPAGIGAIICSDSALSMAIEREYSGGTQNPGLMAGFTAALHNWQKYQKPEEYQKWFMKLYAAEFENDRKWRILVENGETINSTTCLLAVKRPRGAIRGINYALAYLGSKGVLVSETSACASQIDPEVPLFYEVNTGLEDIIRVSWGCLTKEYEIDKLITTLGEI